MTSNRGGLVQVQPTTKVLTKYHQLLSSSSNYNTVPIADGSCSVTTSEVTWDPSHLQPVTWLIWHHVTWPLPGLNVLSTWQGHDMCHDVCHHICHPSSNCLSMARGRLSLSCLTSFVMSADLPYVISYVKMSSRLASVMSISVFLSYCLWYCLSLWCYVIYQLPCHLSHHLAGDTTGDTWCRLSCHVSFHRSFTNHVPCHAMCHVTCHVIDTCHMSIICQFVCCCCCGAGCFHLCVHLPVHKHLNDYVICDAWGVSVNHPSTCVNLRVT